MLHKFLLHPPLQEVHLSALPRPPLQLRTWAKLPRGSLTFLIASMVREAFCNVLLFFFLPFSFNFIVAPTHLLWHFNGCNDDLFRCTCTYHLACKVAHAYMLLAYVKLCGTAMNMVLKFTLTGLFSFISLFFFIDLSLLVHGGVWIRSSFLVMFLN